VVLNLRCDVGSYRRQDPEPSGQFRQCDGMNAHCLGDGDYSLRFDESLQLGAFGL